MKKLRGFVVLLMVGTAFAFSLVMIRQVVAIRSAWFGSIVMLDCLGLAAFARTLIPLRLPGLSRELRRRERGGIYSALRVPEFGVLLRRTALRHLNTSVYLRDDMKLGAVQAQIKSAEVAHFLAATVLLPWMAFAIVDRRWLGFGCLTLVQIFGNLYPILHLRLARVRIARLEHRWVGSKA